jgi:hypothetical protein
MIPDAHMRFRPDPGVEIASIATFALQGPMTVFLGAGASVDARFSSFPLPMYWDGPPRDAVLPADRLPTGKELAAWLAEAFAYPDDEEISLPRVAEWVELLAGRGTLSNILEVVFGRDGDPGVAHQFLAEHCRTIRLERTATRFPGVCDHQL